MAPAANQNWNSWYPAAISNQPISWTPWNQLTPKPEPQYQTQPFYQSWNAWNQMPVSPVYPTYPVSDNWWNNPAPHNWWATPPATKTTWWDSVAPFNDDSSTYLQSTNVAALPLIVGGVSNAAAFEAQALAWIRENPTFTHTNTGGEFDQYGNCWGTNGGGSFGLHFSRPIVPGVPLSASDLQAALDFMSVESVALPATYPSPGGWDVTASAPVSSFSNGEDGQQISMDSFDGNTLRWSVFPMNFFAIGGEERKVADQMTYVADAPMPKDSYFQARKPFQGYLSFECKVVRTIQ